MPAKETPYQSKWKTFWKLFYKQRYLQMLAIPGILLLLFFAYIPMLGLVIAFKNYRVIDTIMGAPWVGLAIFERVLTDPDLALAVRNTLVMSAISLLGGFPLTIIFALLINELKSIRIKRITQTISYLPHFISWVILGGMIRNYLGLYGLINNLLIAAHLIKEPILFLGEPTMFWPIAFITGQWKELGWSTILFLASMASINPELYESADMDGAGRFRKMWHITLPSIKFTISIVLILNISNILNSNFDQIMVLSNTLNRSTSDVIDVFIYRLGLIYSQYSYATAAGLLKSIIALFLLLLANYGSKKLTDTSFL